VVRISGVNRAPIRGSFLISAFARVGGKRVHLGTQGVLSRWSVQGCANCQTHLEVKAHFPVEGLDVDESKIEVEIRTRDGALAAGEHGAAALAVPHSPRRLFHLEVR
jgi:tyrosinase